MAALSLVSSNDHDVSVNTEAAKNLMADQLDSLSIVTSYAHAIGNTVINPVSTPAESWFAPLNANLNEAKAHALVWVRDIAPKIGSEIPQTIINYNNRFLAVTAEMLSIVEGKSELTLAEKKALIELIDATLQSLHTQRSKVDAVQSQIVTLSDHFAADHDKLVNGRDGAANALNFAKAERQAIENKILELQTELADARQKVTVSGIGLGLSIFLAVAAFALAVATAGAGTALIVAGAVGVIGVGTAATFTGIFTAKIGRLLEEIAERQSALEDKKKQVTAIEGLVNTMNTLSTHNEAAKTALVQISTMWKTLGEKLESVRDELDEARGDSIGAAVRRMNINTARTNWKDTADWAKKIQNLASGTKVQPVIQHRGLFAA
jgi:predicted  nucleic acid-binding Zn-ribbon protein